MQFQVFYAITASFFLAVVHIFPLITFSFPQLTTQQLYTFSPYVVPVSQVSTLLKLTQSSSDKLNSSLDHLICWAHYISSKLHHGMYEDIINPHIRAAVFVQRFQNSHLRIDIRLLAMKKIQGCQSPRTGNSSSSAFCSHSYLANSGHSQIHAFLSHGPRKQNIFTCIQILGLLMFCYLGQIWSFLCSPEA